VDYANGNPVANLTLIRSSFFAQPGVTLGGRKKQVISQADSFDPAHPAVSSIASHTLDFGKPVLLFNGDSHVYRSDNPLSAFDPLNYIHPGYNVPNFHRVVVHGSTFPLEWLRLTVDPQADNAPDANAFGPFSWDEVQP
jgi:hypothetical protein